MTLPIDLIVQGFLRHTGPIDETDDAHLSGTFRTGKRVCFVDLSDKVG